MKRTEIGNFLVIDPKVCHGRMTFKGTRVPVDTVLTLLGKGYPLEQLLSSYPEVPPKAVEEALELAVQLLQKQYRLIAA